MSNTNISPTIFGPSNLVEMVQYRAIAQPNESAFVYLSNGIDAELSLTNAELDRKAREIALWLQQRNSEGKRILLLYPPGLDFITAFFGCLYAGAIAVPVYPPKKNRSILRIQAIADSADASAALTTRDTLHRIETLVGDTSEIRSISWLATDMLPPEGSEQWTCPKIDAETVAFLQYTSGSTGTPKGVVLTHGNLIHNSRLIQLGFEHTRHDLGVFWLPAYHDMGLIGGILQPLFCGRPNVLMSPLSFLQKPIRWLEAITRYRASTSGGPNFAYDLCVRQIKDDQLEQLDLSCWKIAFNGAEPVQADTLEAFAEKFEPCGFRYEAFYPCFGLAEGTLLVSGGYVCEPPLIKNFDTESLAHGKVAEVSAEHENAKRFVSSGRNFIDQSIRIVHPETEGECKENEVGEIWVKGPSIAKGYWKSPEITKSTFQAYIADSNEGPYMRTGDLGFMRDGELFVTGRIKDLIIVRGVNIYPQDIEATVQKSDPHLRINCGGAFMIEDGKTERLVIVQELERRFKDDPTPIFEEIRKSVAIEHEIPVDAIVLVKAGSIPKTSSGKIQRHACRSGFLDGSLSHIASWNSADGELRFVPKFEEGEVERDKGISPSVVPLRPQSRLHPESTVGQGPVSGEKFVSDPHESPSPLISGEKNILPFPGESHSEAAVPSAASSISPEKKEPTHSLAESIQKERKEAEKRLQSVHRPPHHPFSPQTGKTSKVAGREIPTRISLENASTGDIASIVLEEVKAVAKERATALTLETDITELGLDSLERMEILASLEDRFGGQFPEQILPDLLTAQQVVEAVEQYLGSGPKPLRKTDGNAAGDSEIAEDRFRFDQFPEYRQLREKLDLVDHIGLNHFFDVHEGITNDRTVIGGKEYINFSNYNYVNTSGDPIVVKAAQDAAAKYGTSVSASRLVSGEKPVHRELENAISRFLSTEDTIVMVGGHSTNESVIGHLLGPEDMILHDSLAHNSIVQGAILSGARRRPFPHNDWEAADWILQKHRREYRRVLIAVEGVYSMDGDYPDLPKFIEVKKRHQSLLMVDEAHSLGVLGKTGRGIGEHFSVDRSEVDIWMCTLSKTFGSCGGYISGSKALVEYLKYTAPGFVFSVGISPPNAAAALSALQLLDREPQRVEQLRKNCDLLLRLAKEKGLNTGMSKDSAVVPVILGNSMLCLRLSKALFDRGINVQPILHPAVEEKAARLRFFITSSHKEEQIRYTINTTAEELQRLQKENS